MIPTMKAFVSSEVCLKCQGCCRFHDQNSDWRPRLGDEEQEILKSYNSVEANGYVKTCTHGDGYRCFHFNPHDNTCSVYDQRPFDCIFYPFLLSKIAEGIGVFAHLSCPYVQENLNTPYLDEYVAYLKDFFHQPDVQEFLLMNPSVIHDYQSYADEMMLVLTIPFYQCEVEGNIDAV